jgi:drug/metabolite transporter (DMT)-like permease
MTAADSHRQTDSTAALSDLSLLSVAIIWGLNIPIMKNGMDSSDRFWFNGVRLLISAIVLAALAVRDARRGTRPASSLGRRQILTYALVVSVLYQFLFLLGISMTTSGNTALIICTIPMWTAIGARVFLRERLNALAWTGLIVAFVGTFIVTVQGQQLDISGESMWGNLFVLTAAVSWAAGTIYSRPLLRQISPLQLASRSAVIGAPFHLLIAAPAILSMPSYSFDIDVWLALLYSGIFSTGLALALWNFGVQHAGAAHAAVVQNLVPIIAMGSAFFLRDEAITTAQMIGGVLIISGLLIMRSGRTSPQPAVGVQPAGEA